MHRLALALLILTALLAPLLPVQPVAAAEEIRLSVPYIDQFTSAKRSNDCGPASIGMVIAAYGKRPLSMVNDDTAYLNYVRSLMQNYDDNTGDVDRERALNAVGLPFTKIPKPTNASDMAPFQAIEQALQQRKPIVMRVATQVLGRTYPSHAIVVVGISADRKTIFVNDPDSSTRGGSTPGGAAAWSYDKFQASVRAVSTSFVGHIVGDGLLSTANKADFISQQFNGTMRPGETQTASITVRNSGTRTWLDDTNLVALVPGETHPFYDRDTWRTGTRIASGNGTAPGQTKTFTFTLRAPSSPGNYKISFAFVQEGVEFFNQPAQGGIWFYVTVIGQETGCVAAPTPFLSSTTPLAASAPGSTVWFQAFGETSDLICAGDMDGDGRSDLIAGTARTDEARRVMSWYLLRSTGANFEDKGLMLPSYGEAGDRFFIADLNGDGRDDILVATARGNIGGEQNLIWYGTLNTSNGWIDLGELSYGFGRPEDQFFVVDMTGDGKADVVAATSRAATTSGALAWYQLTSTGDTLVDSGRIAGAFGEPGDILLAGDVTGDGRAELLAGTTRGVSTPQVLTWYLLTSSAGSLISKGPLTGGYGAVGDYFTLGDVDGDGDMDVIAATARTNGDGSLRWYAAGLTRDDQLTDIGPGVWHDRWGAVGQWFLIQDFTGGAGGKVDIATGALTDGALQWSMRGDYRVYLPLNRR